MASLKPGQFMASELGQAAEVFVRAATADLRLGALSDPMSQATAFYTVARGSSDAAASILSYEFMRELSKPMTSLPPSTFSIGAGIAMKRAVGLVISQSGASDDLVRTASGIRSAQGKMIAITNVPGSKVEAVSDLCIPISAGEEQAVPATKTVVGAVAAGLSLLACLKPDYRPRLQASAKNFAEVGDLPQQQRDAIGRALLTSGHVFVVGRDTGFGAAQEIALKIKETCSIHAESYSASEVLHGPFQLASKLLTVLVLDTGLPQAATSIETAVECFERSGAQVFRICPGVEGLTPAAAAAALLRHLYPAILDAALKLGKNPDAPSRLSKVTDTR